MAQAAGYSFNTDTVTGTTVRDLAGYFLDGTLVGSAALTTGKSGYGNALSLTGGAMQVPVADDTYPLSDVAGLAVAAWVKLDTTTAASRCIASIHTGSGSLDWALYASNASGNVEFVIEGAAYSTSTSVRDGSWHHVVAALDRTLGAGAEVVRIAIDGTIVLSTSGLTTNFQYFGGALLEAGRNVLTGTEVLDGAVDDLRWWNDPVETAYWSTIRDAEQVDLQLGIYPFDDGTGDDSSIYNRDLTLAGSASFVAGLYGSALRSAAAAAGGSVAVNFGDVDRLAITGWVRLDTAPVGSAAPVMALADAGGSNKFRAVVNTDRTITCTWVTIYGTLSVTSTSALTVGQWARFHFNMNPTYVGIRLDSTSQTTVSTGNSFPHLTPTVLDLKTLFVGGDATAGGQVSFDYVTFTQNFVDQPKNTYWAGPPISAPSRPANVARGIYEFNENTGTTTDDKSTFNNDLTLTASGGWTPGVQGSALSNVGSDGAGARSTSLAWSSSPKGWSFAGWFKCRATSNGARIVAMRNPTSEVAHAFRFSTQFTIRLFDASGNTGLVSPAGGVITAETWTHLAASCNGSTIEFFKDGVHYGSADYAGGALLTPTELNVGGDVADGSGQEVADAVDSLQFFDTPISPSNVAWLYANPGALATPPVDVTLATAHETDTAHPLAPAKSVTFGTGHETGTAYGFAASKSVTLGTADESDTAHPLAVAKATPLATASEVDTAYPVAATKTSQLGTASETDTTHPLLVSKTVILETAHETDRAFVVSVDNAGAARVLETAHETDTAYSFTASKTVTLQTVHEVDRAFALILQGSGPKWPEFTVSNEPASRLEVSHGI